MAGQPKRRRQREALAQLPPDIGKPRQPGESDEQFIRRLRAEVRQIDQITRERDLRAGRRRPRTMAEMQIFASDLTRGPSGDETETDPPAKADPQ